MKWDAQQQTCQNQDTITNKIITPCSLWDGFLNGMGIAHNVEEHDNCIEIQIGILESYDIEWNTVFHRKYFSDNAKENTSEYSLSIIFDKAGQFKRFDIYAAE